MPFAREAETHGRELYAPKEGFAADVDGVPVVFTTHTLVREGHPILTKYPEMFEPVRVHYDVEEATAAPGGKRAR